MQLSEHFSLLEFTVSTTAISMGNENKPTPEHMTNLQNSAKCMEDVRALHRRIEITSGYRNPEVNAAVGGVPTSAHALVSHAADFHVDGLTDLAVAKSIRDSALKFDQTHP